MNLYKFAGSILVKTSLWLGLSALLLLDSCSRSSPIPPTSPQPTGSLNINLTNSLQDAASTSFELIVSDRSGNKLLDTTMVYGSNIKMTLKTDDTLFNVMSIAHNTSNGIYFAYLYKDVNPSTWTKLNWFSYSAAIPAGSISLGRIYYNHVKPVKQIPYFSSGGSGYALSLI
ncbi:MAG TPA: hypothetical protein VF939_20710 [Puia sp.]